jgi:L-asparaginase II
MTRFFAEMPNPILVEVTRGERVESIHRGAIAVADRNGALKLAIGDVTAPVYPRSALKPVQAVPLIESGAADRFGLSDVEIALACASHSGEAIHTGPVAQWLARIGCSVADLACGPQRPSNEATAIAMIKSGEQWTPLHNNCSGKHTGFMTLARGLNAPTAGYEQHDHPVQRAVERTLCEMAALSGELPWGIDGCTVPNFAVPLTALARALAQFADPSGLPPARRQATERILRATRAHPELIAGTGRCCTLLMRQNPDLVVKTGAEGVYVAILPSLGLGATLKIDDGATRASETAIAALLIALGVLPDEGAAASLAHAPVRNTRKVQVGERRMAAGVF